MADGTLTSRDTLAARFPYPGVAAADRGKAKPAATGLARAAPPASAGRPRVDPRKYGKM